MRVELISLIGAARNEQYGAKKITMKITYLYAKRNLMLGIGAKVCEE
jgi:hypothetical protein